MVEVEVEDNCSRRPPFHLRLQRIEVNEEDVDGYNLGFYINRLDWGGSVLRPSDTYPDCLWEIPSPKQSFWKRLRIRKVPNNRLWTPSFSKALRGLYGLHPLPMNTKSQLIAIGLWTITFVADICTCTFWTMSAFNCFSFVFCKPLQFHFTRTQRTPVILVRNTNVRRGCGSPQWRSMEKWGGGGLRLWPIEVSY